MILFAIALLCLGGLVALISGIWTVALAVHRDVKWGFAVDWREARLPVFVGVASLFLVASALLHLPHGTLSAPLQKVIAVVQNNKAEEKAMNDQSMFAVRLDAERQLQLMNLKRREALLAARQAALAPTDQSGAEKLSDEIRKYNSELKPILAQSR